MKIFRSYKNVDRPFFEPLYLCSVRSPSEHFLSLPLDHAMLCHVELADRNSEAQIRLFIIYKIPD
ncbi:hypothetical protein F4823DRAFT_275590 [Ustulina deusta]|nr:hypothetical protein F4823DRAFT_275590 [Ustulina deusta]